MFAQIALAAGLLIEGEEELAKGRTRTELGDPPGKLNSMGDRLNWEMLLKNATPKVDLHIVSKDGDFASSIDAKQAHPVLTSEWEAKNGGKLILYSDLRSFFAKHFPEIELATDVEKKEAIDRLRLSGNFARTHLAISKLEPFMSLLSAAELDELMEAGLNNEQIRWIGTDADVSNFFCEVAKKRWETYPPEKQQDILAVFGLQLVEPAKA